MKKPIMEEANNSEMIIWSWECGEERKQTHIQNEVQF